MMFPKIITDARTQNTPEKSIAENIVSGVMKESGLPSIANIVAGPGKSMRLARDTKESPTETVPMEDRSATPQESGGARYIGSQYKGGSAKTVGRGKKANMGM
jgi:hypothetical protein